MVAVAFHAEMYQNDIFFYFLKIIFEISMLKRFKTYIKKLIFCKNKIKFWERGLHRVPKRTLNMFSS